MGGFGSMESLAVGGNVVFEGFGVDGGWVFCRGVRVDGQFASWSGAPGCTRGQSW